MVKGVGNMGSGGGEGWKKVWQVVEEEDGSIVAVSYRRTEVGVELFPEVSVNLTPDQAREMAAQLLNAADRATVSGSRIRGAHIILDRDEINSLLAGENVDEYALVSDEETGEDWYRGIRRQMVVTAGDGHFWAIERRVPTDDTAEWDCRDQNGPEYRLNMVLPVYTVKTVYRWMS